MSEIKIKPGTLLLEKKYNIVKSLVYKLLRKELPYNHLTITLGNIIHDNKGIYYTPKKEYSKLEKDKLEILLEDMSLPIVDIINLIRPKTVSNPSKFKIEDITRNKYYKRLNGEETERISTVRK